MGLEKDKQVKAKACYLAFKVYTRGQEDSYRSMEMSKLVCELQMMLGAA